MKPKRLNLGSYCYPLDDYVNVDILSWTGKEEIVDLNKLPWPWETASIEEVRAFDILEHLDKLTKREIIEELARITNRGARILIRVPCVSHPWALASLQHAHAFNYNSFEESYAQKWFCARVLSAQFSDKGWSFNWNRFLRFLCKWTRLIQSITFELVRL